ncbi:MAG: hypothetical protein NC320_05230 [Clostridium sp.]|nr:hypothetical protein [Clostridium sp.]MCM1547388.1 hypothetical protein [Ruminococcus sp.]
MSHSKYTKRGYSLYIEKWNPYAKKYINICSVCGKRGYSPAIEEACFRSNRENIAIYEELSKTLRKMELDSFGRCEECAMVQDRRK